jgi:hypothetical protein
MCEWFQKKKPRWDGRFWIESHGMKLPAGRPEFPGVQVKPQVWVPTTSALQHTFQCNIQPGCRLYGFDLMDFEEDSEVEISIKKTGSGNEENWDVLLCTRVSRDVAALELHSPMNLPPEASFRIQSSKEITKDQKVIVKSTTYHGSTRTTSQDQTGAFDMGMTLTSDKGVLMVHQDLTVTDNSAKVLSLMSLMMLGQSSVLEMFRQSNDNIEMTGAFLRHDPG